MEQLGGPPVKPYQPPGIWEELTFGRIRYEQDRGASLYRRSLYTFWRRTVGPTNLFDAAARQGCEVKPSRTNTPIHALVTLNDVTYVEAARVLGARALREGGGTASERAGVAVPPGDGPAAAVARAVNPRAGAEAVARHSTRADPEAAKKIVQAGASPVEAKQDAVELASYAVLASLILNLDEVITKE